MVTIRLSRAGSRKNPFYHITVADRAAKRDGRFVERVGFYNPVAKGLSEELRVDLNRVDYWLSVGACPSPMVDQLVRRARTQAVAAEAA
jgi:small subunit ribosomal protein S16